MAKKKKKKKKVAIERKFIIRFSKLYNQPRQKRANKAIAFLHRFFFKHFRVAAENIFLSNQLNQLIWSHGREHIPRRIEVKAIFSENKLRVFLPDEKVAVPKKEEKEKKEKTAEEKKREAELQRQREEKREKEKAAEAIAIKKGEK